MVHVRPLERATDFRPDDAVFVSLSLGIEARMEVGMNLFGREHPDGGRQQAVHGAAQVGERDRIFDAERRHLRQRVHSGIRASGPGHVHRPAFHARRRSPPECPGWSASPGCTCQPWNASPS